MRITHDMLMKVASDAVARQARQNRDLLSAYRTEESRSPAHPTHERIVRDQATGHGLEARPGPAE